MRPSTVTRRRLEFLQPRVEIGVQVAIALLQGGDLVGQRLDLPAQLGHFLPQRIVLVDELELAALSGIEAAGEFGVFLLQRRFHGRDPLPQFEDRLARVVVGKELRVDRQRNGQCEGGGENSVGSCVPWIPTSWMRRPEGRPRVQLFQRWAPGRPKPNLLTIPLECTCDAQQRVAYTRRYL